VALYEVVCGNIARTHARVVSLNQLVHVNIARLNTAIARVLRAIRDDGTSDCSYAEAKESRNIRNDEKRHFGG
jgi:hypothetical protein